MIDYQPTPFPILAGVDTKESETSCPAPKLLVAENCFAERTRSLRKRKATTAFSSSTVDSSTITSNPAALVPHKDSVVMFRSPTEPQDDVTQGVYEYSKTAARWSERGEYLPGHLEAFGIAGSTAESGVWKAEAAVANGYTLFAWVDAAVTSTGTSYLRVALQDSKGTYLTHRTHIYAWTSSAGSGYKPNLRVVARGNQFYVFFGHMTDRDVMVWLCDTTSPATITTALGTNLISPAAPVVVAADLHASDTAVFDVDVNPTYGVFLAYKTTTATVIGRGFVNPSGALVNSDTTTVATAPDIIGVACNAFDNNHQAIVYATNTAVTDIVTLIRTWNGSSWTSTVTTAAMDTFGAADTVRSLTARWTSSTVVRLWYTADKTDGPAPNAAQGAVSIQDKSRYKVYQSTVNTSAAISLRTGTLRRAMMASRPFLASDGLLYFWVLVGYRDSGSSTQPTHFLVDLMGHVVQRMHHAIAAGKAPGSNLSEGGEAAVTLPAVATMPNGGYGVALPYITRLTAGFSESGTSVRAARMVTWRDTSQDSHRAMQVDDSLYLAAGIMQQYSGHSFREVSFLNWVDSPLINLAPSDGSGEMTAGAIYYYKIIPEWINEFGRREQGTNTGPTPSVTLGAADDTVSLTIPSFVQSQTTKIDGSGTQMKPPMPQPLVWAIYRTVANPASSASDYFRVGELRNNPSADDSTFVDRLSDSTLVLNERIYLGTGEVDHLAPPSAHIACEGIGRVFLAGIPDEPNKIWFSLLRGSDEPLSFNDALTLQIPDKGGKIIALAVFQESLVVFEERAIYRVRGQGPDNTLSSGAFLEPELLVDGIGCTNQRSAVVTKLGVAFQATHGFQMLNESFEVDFFGAPLQGLTGTQAATNVITGAVFLSHEQQIRFTSADTIWVFDYYHNIWTVYTGQSVTGPSCRFVDVNGVVGHVWAGTSGVFHESDVGYWSTTNMRVVLAWARLGPTLQDDMMLNMIALTGDVVGAPNLRIQFYKNLRTSTAMSKTATAMTAGPMLLQWRANDALRVASAVKVEIDDNTSPNGRFSLNEIALELGRRVSGVSRRG